MWRRRRTTSSTPTSTIRRSSITSLINRHRRRQPAPVLSPGAERSTQCQGASFAAGCRRAGAGRCDAGAAARRRAKGDPDPARQTAGAAECLDQSCREAGLSDSSVRQRTRCGRYPGRPERYQGCAQCTAAGQCDPKRATAPNTPPPGPQGLPKANALPVPGAKGRTARTAGRSGKSAERGQSECEACAAPTGITASAIGNGASGRGCSQRSRNRWRFETAGRGSRAGTRPAETGCPGSGPGGQRQADGCAGRGHEAFGGSTCNPAKARSRAAATAAFGRSETASAARRAPVAAASRCASGKASASAIAAFGCSETASAAGRAPVAVASHYASGKTRASATAAGSGTATAAPASRGTSATSATDGGAIATAAGCCTATAAPPDGCAAATAAASGSAASATSDGAAAPPPPPRPAPPQPAAAAKKCPPNVPRC